MARHKSDRNYKIDFKNKRVLVMGLGLHGGGVGAVRFLAKQGALVTVTDLRTKKVLQPSLEKLKDLQGIAYVLGKHRENDVLKSDLIVKNPGVPPTSPYLALARKHKIPVTTDMGIFFRECPGTIIGITGTRGKSTTAWLIGKFLQTKYRRVFLGGNIRKSVLEFLPELKLNDLIVLELSSFQLQDLSLDRVSPPVAVLTNFMRDHLNWHRSMAEYRAAKSVIFKFQKPEDYLFANFDDPQVRAMIRKAHSHVVLPRLAPQYTLVVDEHLGAHYRSSVGLAIAVARHFRVKPDNILAVLKKFRGLEGRQERLPSVQGAHVINDTTATIPDAAIAALMRVHAQKKPNERIILIAGGSDKKLIFDDFAKVILRYADELVLLPGNATEKIKKNLQKMQTKNKEKNALPVHDAKTMHDACTKALNLARKGDWILLSPGATSFGLFMNEFDRGDQFVKEIKNLSK
ncbi:MAG: UDP-N-acetylmuramoyl-L-alanine--D-glutamate ligase [Candidatus Sungbacteria bacterium]|nr:UDP-N-acetylmuramoyl-L-alanine--D-glutamate ligase [Candidatus Sungbacteria bacterium]